MSEESNKTGSDGRLDISRRRLLAGVGTAAGAATAASGVAYFTDTEPLGGNQLTGGSLDLKVDWEEHYSGRPADESEGLENEVLMEAPDDAEMYVGLPDPENPLVWVHEDDLDQFMHNTAVEAFPDPNDDGIQGGPDFEYDACEMGADLPEDLDPSGDALRTANEDTWDGESPLPIVNLNDVMPGDFGELTLSFHLCDNPGYVWLQADNVSAAENGLTDPEAEDPDEDGAPDATDIANVELAQEIRTAWWYDTDGDNVIDQGADMVDAMVLLDESVSLDESELETLRHAADELVAGLVNNGDTQVGGIRFGDENVIVDSTLGGSFTFEGSGAGAGITPLPPALDIADQHLDDAGRADAEQVIIVLTDGGPNYQNQVYTSTGEAELVAPRNGTFSADPSDQAYDNGSNDRVTGPELDETALVAENIKTGSGDDSGDSSRIVTVGVGEPKEVAGTTFEQFLRERIATSPADHYVTSFDTIDTTVNRVVSRVLGDAVFRRGTLADDLAALSTDNGIPLDGTFSTAYDEVNAIGNETGEDVGQRECFEPLTDHHIGFAWWLPAERANEIQTDSVTFDLGFYVEQCRHNDGAGAEPPVEEAPTLVPEGPTVGIRTVAEGLTSPTTLSTAPGETDTRYIVDQPGVIYSHGPDGTVAEFMDIRDRVIDLDPGFDERGLLGLAFHPNYQENGKFYVRYSSELDDSLVPEGSDPAEWDHTSVVAEFEANADRTAGDPATERILMEYAQPQFNHNAGALAFGPDGYLYIATGDGGGANDIGPGHVDDWYADNEGGNGQNTSDTLLGGMLRIDVDNQDDGLEYAIPSDNPLVGDDGHREEYYAWGMRNPWGMAFDEETGELLAADVGQNLIESVNHVQKGGNYGWNVKEGTQCFSTDTPSDPPADCPDETPDDVRGGEPLLDPVLEYPHSYDDQTIGRSIAGGDIYRTDTDTLPELQDTYVFGDWSGELAGKLFVASPPADWQNGAEADPDFQDQTGGYDSDLFDESKWDGLWPIEEILVDGPDAVVHEEDSNRLADFVLAVESDHSGDLYVLTNDSAGPSGDGGKVHKIVPPGE